MTAHKGPDRSLAAVVLAAGSASRFGAPKQRLFLPRVLEALARSQVGTVVVVAGAHHLEAPGVSIVRAKEWTRGPGASLRAGLAQLASEVDAALVVLADGPGLAPEAVARVAAARERSRPGHVLAATYDGRTRGHPVLIERVLWRAIPDEGARSLPAILVDCRDIDPPGDVDRADEKGRAEPPPLTEA